jgi:pSer/pThr/pTyr-binding forkhead associated (FHA) protein
MLKLILNEGANPRMLKLEQDVIAIGRAKENNIVIKNIKASRRHARIERIGATYQITDLGSGNGTKVNGKKVDFQALNQGDEIGIGDAKLTLKAIDDGPDAMDAVDEEIKIADDANDKIDLVDEPETERLAISEAETEVQAPAVTAKPASKPAPTKPGLAKPGAPAAKPGLKKPLGRPGPK